MADSALRQAGTVLMIAGAVAASPLDELAAVAATGGAALPATLVQGPTTLLAGLSTMALGGVLYWAGGPSSSRRRR